MQFVDGFSPTGDVFICLAVEAAVGVYCVQAIVINAQRVNVYEILNPFDFGCCAGSVR
jgi:hypothetical protein